MSDSHPVSTRAPCDLDGHDGPGWAWLGLVCTHVYMYGRGCVHMVEDVEVWWTMWIVRQPKEIVALGNERGTMSSHGVDSMS